MESCRISRRSILCYVPAWLVSTRLTSAQVYLEESFADIERSIGGRLGVAAIDTGSGHRLAYRGDERFAMCSTFKLLLAACILEGVDAGKEHINRRISYTINDLLQYAPVTGLHVKEGAMTVEALCAAAVEKSDNTAANLLLAQIGGPGGLTKFLRSIGDRVTRLDRIEPDLNEAAPGDSRDTTSPSAMVSSAAKLLTGEVLSRSSRNQLASWLEQSTTGANRLRAGFPVGWRAGDKTGTGEQGAMGDVGIFWPPGRPPILVAAHVMEGNGAAEKREQAIARAGRIVASALR